MNKDQVANKLWEDVNAIIAASFYNAELSYNKQKKTWCIRAQFIPEEIVSSSKIASLFESAGMSVEVKGKKISVKKKYKDTTPS